MGFRSSTGGGEGSLFRLLPSRLADKKGAKMNTEEQRALAHRRKAWAKLAPKYDKQKGRSFFAPPLLLGEPKVTGAPTPRSGTGPVPPRLRTRTRIPSGRGDRPSVALHRRSHLPALPACTS